MSADAQTAAPSSSPARQPSRTGQAFFDGLAILYVRPIDTASGRVFLTLARLPNPDAFTSGGTVEIRSSKRLGSPGESWRGWARVGGYPRTYRDSEDHPVRTANNTLSLVEE